MVSRKSIRIISGEVGPYPVAEKRLPVLLTTHYKPTSLGIKIIESTCYRENIIIKIA